MQVAHQENFCFYEIFQTFQFDYSAQWSKLAGTELYDFSKIGFQEHVFSENIGRQVRQFFPRLILKLDTREKYSNKI